MIKHSTLTLQTKISYSYKIAAVKNCKPVQQKKILVPISFSFFC